MKKLVILLIIIGLAVTKSFSSHLVGGDLGMEHIGNFEYELSLDLYFDDVSGSQEAEDDLVRVSVFEMKSNKRIEIFTLKKSSSVALNYTNPSCKTGSLRTKIISYLGRYFLSPDIYTDPAGYYMVWERCCRNGGISNITNPGQTGMVFYLEFPRVALPNGNAIVNSSPVLAEPLGDYLCRGELYSYDFKAIDKDGDSLVYKLSTPLSGHTSSSDPLTHDLPGPYPRINWSPGFSDLNMINGSPALSINSSTGVISLSPSQIGLFVFGIICEEYRNGVKIGVVRREMQIKVLNCATNQSPSLSLALPNSNTRYTVGDTIVITGAENYCMDVFSSDPNSGQELTITALPKNFKGRAPVFTSTNTQSNSGNSVLEGKLCWGDCGLAANQEIFLVDLIVSDDGCSVPKTDTIPIIFKVIPNPNNPPTIRTDLPNNTTTARTNSELLFTVTGLDNDSENLSMSVKGVNFEIESTGMLFDVNKRAGEVVGTLSWLPDCESFSKGFYDLLFVVTDNSCFVRNQDSVKVRINVEEVNSNTENFLPPNIFTPNNDNLNDYFEMPGLPNDNCSDRFQKIIVYNRWGNKVFEDDKRDFKWDGKNTSAGVYYYLIKFQSSTYRGTLTVIR